MNLKSACIGLMAFAIAGAAQAQVFNWPEDEQMEAKAREYNAAYVDYMKSEQFVEATKPLHWLLVNVPNLNESIYINGVNVYKGAADQATDAAKKREYQDSVMTVYNLRNEVYQNENKWVETKAFYAYQFYKDDKAMLGDALGVFDRVFEVNGTLNYPYTVAYFDLVRRHYVFNKAFEDAEILEVYDKIDAILKEAEGDGKDVSTQKSQMEQLLVSMNLIDCDFIENTLGPRFTADPANEVLAQQIFKYAYQYKCMNTNAFLAALELIDSNDPTFSTSQVRAMRYMQNREYDKAQPVLEKALTLAETDVQRASVQMDLARIHAQNGRKSASRAAALEAAKLDAEKAKDAWDLVGNLYMTSFNDCKGGVSRAKDMAVYIAAYNAFQKAGNSKGMADAKSRFPSKEELFTESLAVGDSMSVGCWIGETVTLATRD
ncbi:tetratricopeptide repeat protein [Nitritalea halalkaliphila]|nr:tetratricopeptide repeat protein [Nitritalea halalkaliphila]